MIRYGGIKYDKPTDYIIFLNELDESVEVPIDRRTSKVIEAYLNKLIINPNQEIKIEND